MVPDIYNSYDPIDYENHLPDLSIWGLRQRSVTSLSGFELRALDLSALPTYRHIFDCLRPPELLKRIHPNTLYTNDPAKRVSAEEFIEWSMEQNDRCYFQAVDQEIGVIGHFSAHSINFSDKYCRVSYAVFYPDLWGKGYGKRICSLGVSMLKQFGFTRIEAQADPNNLPSIRLIKRYFPETKTTNDMFKGTLAQTPEDWYWSGIAM